MYYINGSVKELLIEYKNIYRDIYILFNFINGSYLTRFRWLIESCRLYVIFRDLQAYVS